jgi:hypothetical protein
MAVKGKMKSARENATTPHNNLVEIFITTTSFWKPPRQSGSSEKRLGTTGNQRPDFLY